MPGNYAGLALGRIILQFVAKTDEVDLALRQTHKGISEVAVSIAKAGTSFLAFGATASQVFERLAQPMRESIKLAADLNQILNAVTNIMETKGLDGAHRYRDALKELSRTMGIDLVEAVKAFRLLVESGISDKAGILTLQKSAELARISMVDLNTSLDAVRTAVKAWRYDMEGVSSQIKSLNDVTYTLFRAFDYAAGSSEVFQKALAKTSGIAAEAQISLKDFAAAGAALTRVGLRADQGFTSLTNVILSFLKPTGVAKEHVAQLNKQLGLTGDQALELSGKFLKENGLIGSLEKFAQAAGYNADVLANTFTRKGAIVSVFGLMADRFQDAHMAMDGMSDSANGIRMQFEQMQDPAFRIQQSMAQLQSISDSLGKSSLPLVSKILDAMNPILERINVSLSETPQALSLVTAAFGTFVLAGEAISKFAINLGFLSFGILAFRGVINALIKNPAMTIFRGIWGEIAKDLQFLGKGMNALRGAIKAFQASMNAGGGGGLIADLSKAAKNSEGLANALEGVRVAFTKFRALNFVAELRSVDASIASTIGALNRTDDAFLAASKTVGVFSDGAKALINVMANLGKAIKSAPSNLNNIFLSGTSFEDSYKFITNFANASDRSIRKLLVGMTDLDRALTFMGGSSGSLKSTRSSLMALGDSFANFYEATAHGGDIQKTFAAMIYDLNRLKMVSAEALKEVQTGLANAGPFAKGLEQELLAINKVIADISKQRLDLVLGKNAEAIAKAMQELRSGFVGSGGTAGNVIQEWVTSLKLAASDSKLRNALTVMWEPMVNGAKTATTATVQAITTVADQVSKFSARIVADWLKWGIAIEAVTDLFRIFGQAVGFVFDLMATERGFNVVADETRRLIGILDSLGFVVDRNTYSIIKNAEEQAKWAQIMKAVTDGLIYVLKAMENFGITAEIALARVAEWAAKALDVLIDLVAWASDNLFGTKFGDFTGLDAFITKLEEFQEKAAAFISGQPAQWNITKQLVEYNKGLDTTILKYDAVRAALEQWVKDIQKAYATGQITPQFEEAAKKQMEAMLLAAEEYYESSGNMADEETEKRLKEFEKQAFNRKRQLEVELSLFNDYYSELQRAEQRLQSELTKALDYRDQLTIASQITDNPYMYEYLQTELRGVQSYIDSLRGEIGNIKRESLDAELDITQQLTENWDKAEASMTESAGNIADAVFEAGKSAGQTDIEFQNLFNTMSQGLSDAEKTKLADVLLSIKDQSVVLYKYMAEEWAPTAGTDTISNVVTSMLAQWDRDKENLSPALIQGLKDQIGITEEELNKWAEQKAWEGSPIAGYFDAAFEAMKTQAKTKLDEVVPELKEHLLQLIKDQFGSINWSSLLFGGGVAVATGSPALGAAAGAVSNYSQNNSTFGTPLTNAGIGAMGGAVLGGPYGAAVGAILGFAYNSVGKISQEAATAEAALREAYNTSGYAGSFEEFVLAVSNGQLPQYEYILAGITPMAKGGQAHMGGVALVGEEGPELVTLPAGTKVTPAGKTANILKRGGGRIPAYAKGTSDVDATGALISGESSLAYSPLPSQIPAWTREMAEYFIGPMLSGMGYARNSSEWNRVMNYYVGTKLEPSQAQISRIINGGPGVTIESTRVVPPSSNAVSIESARVEPPRSTLVLGNVSGYGDGPYGPRGGYGDGPYPNRAEYQYPYYGLGAGNYNPNYPSYGRPPVDRMRNVNDLDPYQLGPGEHSRPRGNPYARDDMDYMSSSTTGAGADILGGVTESAMRQYLYWREGPIADMVNNGIFTHEQVMAAIVSKGMGGRRYKGPSASHLILGSPQYAGEMTSETRLQTGRGDFSYNRTTGTGRTNFYTSPNEDKITSFIGDIDAMARSGRYGGIPQFDQAQQLWRRMSEIAQKYGYSTSFLAQNSSTFSAKSDGFNFYAPNQPKEGVSTKPSKVSDADIMAFQALYKQVLALLAQSEDQRKKVQGGKARGGDVNIPGSYVVGEKGPELLDLPHGARVVPGVTQAAMRNFRKPRGVANYSNPSSGRRGQIGGVGVFPGHKKPSVDWAGKLEAELRSAPIEKVKEFVRAAMPRGDNAVKFKEWSLDELVDFVMGTVTVQSNMSIQSLYSLWKRVSMQDSSSVGAGGFRQTTDTMPDPDNDRRSIGGGTSGGIRGGRGGSSGGNKGFAPPSPQPKGGGRGKESLYGPKKKDRPANEMGKDDSLRRQLIDGLPGLTMPALVRLLQLLVGVSEAESIMSGDPSKAKLVDYIINDVIRGKNVSTRTLQSYIQRANTALEEPPKPPMVEKGRYTGPQNKPPKGPVSGARTGPSMAGVDAISSIVHADNANTSAMGAAMGAGQAAGGYGGSTSQVFNVGQVRTDEDIARIAMLSQQRVARTLRRAQ